MDTPTLEGLRALLAPFSRFIATLDAADPAAAEAALAGRFPPGTPQLAAVAAQARAAAAHGIICHKGKPGMQFSRIARPGETPGGCSIDAVLMENAKGPAHTHTLGEFCLCLPERGGARFEGRTGTWIVLGKGSRHEPEVSGGRMLILYWLPEGAVVWG